jgi:UDP-2-acetamido-3-amino-2,3-dideoxy-glucuronate N-acetyltransferase
MKNIAVVGAGHWGKNLIRNLNSLGVLQTICDTDNETLQSVDTDGVCNTNDLDVVLHNQQIKGVVVATPPHTHFEIAKQALRHGKDVFIEKPMCLNTRDAKELIEIAEKRKLIIQVGHLLEYHPTIVKIKEFIDSGELGDMRYIYSNRLNLGIFRKDENVLWSFAPHDISVILLLVNDVPIKVTCNGGYYLNKGYADSTISTLSFMDGVEAHIFVSWIHPYKEHKLIIAGSKGMIVFDDINYKGEFHIYREPISVKEGIVYPNKINRASIPCEITEPLLLECRDFVECIETRKQPRVTGEKGLQVLEVLTKLNKALER